MTSDPPHVRRADAGERRAIERLVERTWGLPVVSRGRLCDVAEMQIVVCLDREELLGFATFELRDGDCELVTLLAVTPRVGVGSVLLAHVAEQAADAGCRRLWLVTTNDNLDALRFYQRRGMRLVAVHRDAMEEVRRHKPGVPQIGAYGIALRDELELELMLS